MTYSKISHPDRSQLSGFFLSLAACLIPFGAAAKVPDFTKGEELVSITKS